MAPAGAAGDGSIRVTGLAEPLRVAVQVFVERRLLLSDTEDDGQVWLTVAHEALLTGWRPLDTATADITAALRTARAAEQAAAEWNSADRRQKRRRRRYSRRGVINDALAGRLRDLAGLRNRLVHVYDEIDDARVHEALATGLPDLDAFAAALARLVS